MDSLTQATLGAAVGMAVLRNKTPAWKAALWGAAVGTLPDLDVVLDFGDPIRNMTEHRAQTHAFFFQALTAPLLALIVARPAWMGGRRTGWQTIKPVRHAGYPQWLLTTVLILLTHAVLDGLTVYGTQLWLPFYTEAVGLGSIFIIDPLYTLPMLLGVVLGLVREDAGGTRRLLIGLGLSSLYLLWSVVAQQWVVHQARSQLPEPNAKLLVTAAPFNTVLWRLVAVTDNQRYEGWHSLLDKTDTIRWQAFPRDAVLHRSYIREVPVARLARFSDGFFDLEMDGDALLIKDLRMGQEPNYVFKFRVGTLSEDGDLAIDVTRVTGTRLPIREGLPWLWERMLGRTTATLSETLSETR
jgi:inner membrane protein